MLRRDMIRRKLGGTMIKVKMITEENTFYFAASLVEVSEIEITCILENRAVKIKEEEGVWKNNGKEVLKLVIDGEIAIGGTK